ncbi:MAG TPA: hypothetical protein VLV83_23825, partial [Acidobacteriota bacterium]|nr:hypothetical protein [Acidobacteriota bacterium]
MGKVAKFRWGYKRDTDPIQRLQRGPETEPDYDNDADAVLAGIQNLTRTEGLPWSPAADKWDIVAVSVGEKGQQFGVRWHQQPVGVMLTEAGGIDNQASTDTFDISEPAKADMIEVGDEIRIDKEIMRVESIVTGSPNWTITVERRGDHGTAIAAHLENADVIPVFLPHAHKRTTLTGVPPGVWPAPFNFDAVDGAGSIPLSWEWAAGNDENLRRFAYHEICWVHDEDDPTSSIRNSSDPDDWPADDRIKTRELTHNFRNFVTSARTTPGQAA